MSDKDICITLDHNHSPEPLSDDLRAAYSELNLVSGHDIVICDETNYSKAARNSLKDDIWKVIFYPVLTDPQICKERAVNTGQPDLIPVIDEMWARYEPLDDSDEVWSGAKEVYEVSLLEKQL